MDKIISKLPRFWKSFQLGQYRPANGTYASYLWSEIPPLQREFLGDFEWLGKTFSRKTTKASGATKSTSFASSPDIEKLQKELKITFPADFAALMAVSDWQKQMAASPTAAFSPSSLEVKPFLSGHLVPIYSDQQGVVRWYLYFESDAKSCRESIVLSSNASLEMILKAHHADVEAMLEIAANSYEDFLYRLQLENMAWFSLNQAKAKPAESWKKLIDAYLDFYDDQKWQKKLEKISEKDLAKNFGGLDPVMVVKYKKLSEAFLKHQADGLPWLYVSHYQELSEAFIKEFADQLDWQIMSAHQHFSAKLLADFADRIDWHAAAYFQKIPTSLIEKFADRLDWNGVVMKQEIPLDFYHKYERKINWRALSASPNLREDVIERYGEKLDWQLVSRFAHLSEKLIKKFEDRVNWDLIAQYQQLSEKFILQYQQRLNWWLVSRYQQLTEDFIEAHPYQVIWDNLLQNSNISEAFKKKNLNRGKEIAQKLAAMAEDEIRKNPDQFNFDLLGRVKVLSEKFLEDFEDRINWRSASQFQKFSEKLIRKHKNEVDWRLISLTQTLSEVFVEEFQFKIDWNAIQQNPNFSAEFKEKNRNRANELYQKLSEDELRKIAKDFTPFQFGQLCQQRPLSEPFLEAFAEKINWGTIVRTQKLSENFIRQHQHQVNWWDVSALPLSEDFIREFQDKVEWKIIKKMQKLSKKFEEEFKDKLGK